MVPVPLTAGKCHPIIVSPCWANQCHSPFPFSQTLKGWTGACYQGQLRAKASTIDNQRGLPLSQSTWECVTCKTTKLCPAGKWHPNLAVLTGRRRCEHMHEYSIILWLFHMLYVIDKFECLVNLIEVPGHSELIVSFKTNYGFQF